MHNFGYDKILDVAFGNIQRLLFNKETYASHTLTQHEIKNMGICYNDDVGNVSLIRLPDTYLYFRLLEANK